MLHYIMHMYTYCVYMYIYIYIHIQRALAETILGPGAARPCRPPADRCAHIYIYIYILICVYIHTLYIYIYMYYIVVYFWRGSPRTPRATRRRRIPDYNSYHK